MFLDLFLEFVSSGTAVVTQLTLERLLFQMDPLMTNEMALLNETTTTSRADV